jgi:protein O-mannosyl-transferase
MDLAKQTRRTIVLCALLSAMTLITFWPLRHCDFVNYDDTAYVTENPQVLGGLSLAHAGWAFRTSCLGNWQPLTLLSHMLDVQIFGLNAGRHHLTSVCFHVANTLLLFLVLQRTTGRPWPSVVVAALFALHPLHVESVAWISERKDVLSTFFALLSLWAYARYAEGRRKDAECRMKEAGGVRHLARPIAAFILRPSSFILLSLTFFALSLMSKAMFVTLPFLLLLLDYWPLRRLERTQQEEARVPSAESGITPQTSGFTFHVSRITVFPLLLEKLPFLALSVIATCVSVLLLSGSGATREVMEVGVGDRLARSFVAYQHYLVSLIWPSSLAMPCLRPARLPTWEILSAMVVVSGLTLGAIWQGRRRPYLLVGWLWFLGTLVPVIGLVPLGAHAVADRYTYFPLIGLCLALVWGAAEWPARWSHRRATLAAAAGAVLLGCLVTSRAQVRCWRDSGTLFRHAVAVTSANYIAHGALGLHLFNQGKVDEAIQHFETALRIEPRYDVAHSHLGRALAEQRRYDEAVAHFETALSLRPDDAKTHHNFGSVLMLQGRHAEAVRQFEEVLRLQPDHVGAHNNLAIGYRKLGRIGDAISQYRAALRLPPDSLEALNNLAWLLAAHPDARFRNGAEALSLATRACELTQYQNPVALGTLAAAYAETGRFAEAQSFVQQALELARDRQPALAPRLAAMLEAFHAGRPYHAD